MKIKEKYRRVVAVVARVAHNHKVGGSSPSPATLWKILEENWSNPDVDKSALLS